MKKNKHNYKLTDAQFIEAYRACEGNCSQTSKYIQDHFRIPYSKQAVMDRAEKYPEEVEKLYSLMDNESITGIMKFAVNEDNDIKLRARLYVQVLNQNSRRKRLKIMEVKAQAYADAKKPDLGYTEEYFEVDGYKLHFPTNGNDLPPEKELAWEKCMGSLKKPDPSQQLTSPPQNP